KRDKVQELVSKRGADLHSPDEFGRLPMHYAVMRGWLEVTKLLLDLGARIDATGPLG
ncbi:unnamed protein product, partial [Polarella glacialis]